MSVRDKSADSLVNGKNGGSVEKEMPTEKILLGKEKKVFFPVGTYSPRDTLTRKNIDISHVVRPLNQSIDGT